MRLCLDTGSRIHILSIKRPGVHVFLWKYSQSLPFGYQKYLLMLSLISLHMLASHRSGRPDACGTGFSRCHCGHHRWFHDTVPLGREKPGRESKPITKLNKDSTWATILCLSSGDTDGCQPLGSSAQLSKAELVELCGSSWRLIPPPPLLGLFSPLVETLRPSWAAPH